MKFLEKSKRTLKVIVKIDHRSVRYPLFVIFASILLVLPACQPDTLATDQQPTATSEVPVTETPVQPTPPSDETAGEITLDYSALAQNITIETVAAKSESSGAPYWEVMPDYRFVTLEGYLIAEHLHKPSIYIYPAGELASANKSAGIITTDLQTVLQTQQVGEHLPFLPLFNASQVMHAHVQYLDFKSGKGVRFLTQFDQAPLPINNHELIYTFQGLTSDGKYYIAVVLPVNSLALPEGSDVSEDQAAILEDFPGYISSTVELLNQQPADSFTPDMNVLDALVQSIEVK